MSDTTSAPPAPGVSEPIPAPATPPVAGSDSAPPAAFSPEPAAAPEPAAVEPAPTPEPEPAPTEAKASLLSEATGEKPAEEPAPEAKEEAAAPEAPAEPQPLPTYEKFALPEGVTIQDEKLGAFTGLLGEMEQRLTADPAQAHVVAQEMGQKFLDLYIAEAREAADRFTRLQADNWQRTRETWLAEFREDPDLGKNRQQTTIARMGGLMDLYGQHAGPERLQKLRDVFTMTGAGDNPDVLRFVNWAATRLTETSRVITPTPVRAAVATSRAQRLYKNTGAA